MLDRNRLNSGFSYCSFKGVTLSKKCSISRNSRNYVATYYALDFQHEQVKLSGIRQNKNASLKKGWYYLTK